VEELRSLGVEEWRWGVAKINNQKLASDKNRRAVEHRIGM
jgi:hypothetical protein